MAVARAEASSEPQAVLAKRLGVGRSTLATWISKLRAEQKVHAGHAFLPVRVAPAATPATPAIPMNEILEIFVDGFTLLFVQGTEVNYVLHLVKGLRNC